MATHALPCPVHTPTPCCEGPCEHEATAMLEPTEAVLAAELTAHLERQCAPGGCGYCYEEAMVALYGEEGWAAREADEAAHDAYVLARECTCDEALEARTAERDAAHDGYLGSLVSGTY